MNHGNAYWVGDGRLRYTGGANGTDRLRYTGGASGTDRLRQEGLVEQTG